MGDGGGGEGVGGFRGAPVWLCGRDRVMHVQFSVGWWCMVQAVLVAAAAQVW